MIKELRKTYQWASKLFPNISKVCARCNTCCYTYGWLLDEEAQIFEKMNFPLIGINNDLNCFDSFLRDKKGRRILEKIPRCRFYFNGVCKIYKIRPLDCRLYPIKVRIKKHKIIIGLSLGCKYVSFLSKEKRKVICCNILNFFKKVPKKIIKDFLELNQKISNISQPKKFKMIKLLEFRAIDREIDFF